MNTRFAWLAAPLGAIIFALAGCGGGGHSSSTALVISTDWTHHNTGAIIGQSEKISIFKLDGSLVKAASMNQDQAGIQTLSMTGFPAGTYHVEVDLFTGRDLTGSQTGEIDIQITVRGATIFANAVGDDVTSVKVTPATATVQIPHSQQFYATAYAANNKATFVAPGIAFTWQVLGPVGTVSTTGLFSATTQGTGSVVATHIASSLQGAAAVTVSPFQASMSKWTVIVYMNAANDLNTFSPLNMNQMETVAGNPDVRFVVQWKEASAVPNSTFNSTRRYLVKPDTSSAIVSELVQDMGPGVDMGNKQTLHDFISWAKTYYPAQRYVLIIWNHGNGWRRSPNADYPTRGVSYDDETGNAIQTWELTQALGTNHFDILAWDASLMQMSEVAYEIKDQATYIVGSEESPPGEGYPYDTVFAPFRDNPDAATLTLSKSFVDGMIAAYGSTDRKITQSVLDTSKLPALATSIDVLGSALIANAGSLTTLVPSVRTQAQSYSPTFGRVYRDLWDVCDKLQAGAPPAAVTNACAGVKTAIADAVVWEAHNAQSPGSHGIAIDFSSSAQFAPVAADYGLLRLSSDTSWNEWLTVAP